MPARKRTACYEAGRDGWWLHRWLLEQGIDSIVVDSSSIEVNRGAKRAKTDRLDNDKLLALLRRHHGGERRVWSVLHEPTPQQEDARRTHREIARLTKERKAHTNRIGSLLVLHNLRPGHIGGRDWARWWSNHGEQVPPNLRAEIERESARLALVKEQMKTLEAARRQAIAAGRHPVVAARQIARDRAARRLDLGVVPGQEPEHCAPQALRKKPLGNRRQGTNVPSGRNAPSPARACSCGLKKGPTFPRGLCRALDSAGSYSVALSATE